MNFNSTTTEKFTDGSSGSQQSQSQQESGTTFWDVVKFILGLLFILLIFAFIFGMKILSFLTNPFGIRDSYPPRGYSRGYSRGFSNRSGINIRI